MEPIKLITTSWDDGHVLDFKLAELLQKYNLPATFYIPKTNAEHKVMEASQVVELAKYFEIGGHTLTHVRLRTGNRKIWKAEIEGSFNWLYSLTNTKPVSFCFPGGIYDKEVLDIVFKSGYKLARTTELLSIENGQNNIISTTLQLYNHSAATYLKHLIKRKRWANMARWLSFNSLGNLEKLTADYLDHIEKNNGCFHLWGHSWEIEENNLWNKLEAVFKIIANRSSFLYVPNKDILKIF